MNATVPPVSDLARVELQLRKHRAAGATSLQLASELFMSADVVLPHLRALIAANKAEELPDMGFRRVFRIVRCD